MTLVLYIETEVNWQEQINLYLGLLTELKNNKGRRFSLFLFSLLLTFKTFHSSKFKNNLAKTNHGSATLFKFVGLYLYNVFPLYKGAIEPKLGTTKSQINATVWILLCFAVKLEHWKWILLEAQGFSDVQSHSSMAPGQGILPWTSILRLWEHCLHGWKKAMCLHRCFKLLAHRSSCTEPHHHPLCQGTYTFCISLPFDTEMKGGRGACRLRRRVRNKVKILCSELALN